MVLFRGKKIHLIQMLILSLFIFITAISLHPILIETDRRMNLMKSALIKSLENTINYEISYSSISPSIFSSISINDLIIYKNKDKNIILARIKSFKAFYSPFYFFKKNASQTPLQAVKRFIIYNAEVNISTEREKQLLSLFTVQEKKSSISL